MFKLTSEKELLESFRSFDREEVIPPAELSYPVYVKDYLSWTEPSGYRTYLLFSDGNRRPPLGIVFRRDQSAGGTVARMCEWCHSMRGNDGVSMLTATANSKRRVGLQLCRGLSCKEKLEACIDFTAHDKLRQVLRRMSDFARQNLF